MDVAKKLRIKDSEIVLLNTPDDCEEHFHGYEVKEKVAGDKDIGQLVLFAENKAVLDKEVVKVAKNLAEDALFWIAYPKKSGSIASDLIRDEGWQSVYELEYEPVTSVSINSDWSAVRFRKSHLIGPKKRDIKMAERQVEGVDFVNRTVTPPKDVAGKLKQHKEIQTLFNSMSFSHKREYIEHIVSAKKPETRDRRINKMIELLQETLDKKK